MKHHRILSAYLASAFALGTLGAHAQIPGLLNYQGKIAVGATAFEGAGQFKFSLVSGDGAVTYWSNDGSATAGGEPSAAVTLAVAAGLYSVQLGDTALPNMTAVPAGVFTHGDVRLRVWFNDGANGFEQITPDQRITAVGYAMTAATVPDGSITGEKIAAGAVGSAQLGSNLSLSGTVTAQRFVGDGSGLSGLPSFSGDGMAWRSTTGTTQNADANNGYLADNTAQVLYTLPANAGLGATVRITGINTGGFKVVAGDGQVLKRGALGGSANSLTWSAITLGISNFYPEGQPEKNRIRTSPDASKIMMMGNQQVAQSSDGGETWTQNTLPSANGGYHAISQAFQTSDLSKCYLPTQIYNGATGYYNTSFMESTDLGKNWTASSITFPDGTLLNASLQFPIQLTADGTGMWLFGYYGYNYSTGTNDYRLYSSSDSGATWTQRTLPPGGTYSPQPSNAFHVHPTDASKVIFATYSNSDNRTHYYQTSDYGVNWSEIPVPSANNYGQMSVSSDFTRFFLYRIEYNGSTNVYYSVVSSDSGATWTSTAIRQNPPSNYGLSYFSASDDLLAISAMEQIYNSSTGRYEYGATLSTDGGLTWSSSNGPTFSSTDTYPGAYRVSPNGSKLLMQTYSGNGGFYTTSLNTSGNYQVTGKQWASVEFQYLGSGQWAPITVTGSATAQ